MKEGDTQMNRGQEAENKITYFLEFKFFSSTPIFFFFFIFFFTKTSFFFFY